MSVGRNPENPFVRDEYYFKDAIAYSDTTVSLIHKISNVGAFVIGMSLVFLLTFLIIFKTPSHFRPYSKMVFLCVVTDTIILICDFLCQSRVKIAKSTILLSMTGPVSYFFSYQNLCRSMTLQAAGATIAAAVLPLQYYFRYVTLKRRKAPTNFQCFVYYCIAMAFVSIFVLLALYAYQLDPADLPDLDYGTLWYNEKPIPRLIISSIYSKYFLFEVIYLAIFITCCYILTIWLARQTIKELNAQEFVLSEKTKSLQRQFSKMLLIQALTPLLTSLLPLIIAIVAIASDSSTGYAGEFIIMGVTWFPVFNSFSNLYLIVPYRQYCLKLIPMYRLKETTSIVRPSSVFVEGAQASVNVNQ